MIRIIQFLNPFLESYILQTLHIHIFRVPELSFQPPIPLTMGAPEILLCVFLKFTQPRQFASNPPELSSNEEIQWELYSIAAASSAPWSLVLSFSLVEE